MSDPYLQADGETLKNKLGVESDPDLLGELEAAYVQRRVYALLLDGITDVRGFDLHKAIHRANGAASCGPRRWPSASI